MKVSAMDSRAAVNWGQVAYVYGSFLGVFLLLEGAAVGFIKETADRGAFVVTGFRSNFGIIGLAIVANIFGEDGLSKAALLLALIVPLFNVLSVISLSLPHGEKQPLAFRKMTLEILRNPLIIAVVLGLLTAASGAAVPPIIAKTGDYLAAVTLPLALLAIGGALDFSYLQHFSPVSISATLCKIVLMPLLLTPGALLLNLSAEEVIIMYVLFACPSAVASFIMVKAMGGNDKLAGSVILLTTSLSVLTISAGIFIMKASGYLS